MPDPEEQFQMIRDEEKAERDEEAAEDLTQDGRLAGTLSEQWSEDPGSADGTPPAAP
jgi:hypothetical protein